MNFFACQVALCRFGRNMKLSCRFLLILTGTSPAPKISFFSSKIILFSPYFPIFIRTKLKLPPVRLSSRSHRPNSPYPRQYRQKLTPHASARGITALEKRLTTFVFSGADQANILFRHVPQRTHPLGRLFFTRQIHDAQVRWPKPPKSPRTKAQKRQKTPIPKVSEFFAW